LLLICITVSYPINVQELQTYGQSDACKTIARILVMQGKDSAVEKLDKTEV